MFRLLADVAGRFPGRAGALVFGGELPPDRPGTEPVRQMGILGGGNNTRCSKLPIVEAGAGLEHHVAEPAASDMTISFALERISWNLAACSIPQAVLLGAYSCRISSSSRRRQSCQVPGGLSGSGERCILPRSTPRHARCAVGQSFHSRRRPAPDRSPQHPPHRGASLTPDGDNSRRATRG